MSSASLCLPSQSRSRRFSARAMDCQYRPIFARDTLSLNAEKRQRKRQNRQRNWQKQAGAGKGRAIEAALAIQALRNATEEIFRHQPGFISANLHMSRDKRRVLNYAQWRSKEDYLAMSKKPEIQAHMKQAAALAISFDPVDYDLRDSVLAL